MSLPEPHTPSATTTPALNEMEQDALTELFNMGIGSATALLSELLGEKITLSVPDVEISDRYHLVANVEKEVSDRVVVVRQSFHGNFGGEALLLFPEDRSYTILRGLIDDTMDEEETQELEPEALSELGNIILNGAMGSIADNLDTPFDMSLPTFIKGDAKEVITPGINDMVEVKAHEVCLLIHVNFTMEEIGTNGAIVILMTVESASLLQEAVRRFVTTSLGE